MVVNSSHLVVTKKIQNCHFMSKFGTTANSNMQKTLFFLFEQNNFFFRGGGEGGEGGEGGGSSVMFNGYFLDWKNSIQFT